VLDKKKGASLKMKYKTVTCAEMKEIEKKPRLQV
jgi:hypothetical protein